ncbi:MAG: hypothetical protein OQJ80_01590 [Kangiella sp.]|nr:hypothetical protein [Kangiella sp.]
MSRFKSNSRYVKYSSVYMTTNSKGQKVQALTPAEIPEQRILGEHLIKQGQRLDHLSNHYLNDPAGFWLIAKANDGMTVESVTIRKQIKIPVK